MEYIGGYIKVAIKLIVLGFCIDFIGFGWSWGSLGFGSYNHRN
jgi:hypothetical protein